MDAEVESVMASSHDQREEELQVKITKLPTPANLSQYCRDCKMLFWCDFNKTLLIIIVFQLGILVIHCWHADQSGESAIRQNTFHVAHVCNARHFIKPVQRG